MCMHVKFDLTVPHSQRYGTYTCIYYNKNNRRGHPCPMDTFSSFGDILENVMTNRITFSKNNAIVVFFNKLYALSFFKLHPHELKIPCTICENEFGWQYILII